ncbi:MAG: hypothetical protein EBR82_87420 [Caulobacteraceae bacterium]|nr:hypothetical protein [Caulobacteraceae bacterium]
MRVFCVCQDACRDGIPAGIFTKLSDAIKFIRKQKFWNPIIAEFIIGEPHPVDVYCYKMAGDKK